MRVQTTRVQSASHTHGPCTCRQSRQPSVAGGWPDEPVLALQQRQALHSGRDGTCDRVGRKLQALVYDILPSTTAVFSYDIWSRKQTANEQFFVGARTVVSLLQTAQIKQGVSFIAANKVYTSANKTTTGWIETELFFSFFFFFFFFFNPGWMRLMFKCVLWRG